MLEQTKMHQGYNKVVPFDGGKELSSSQSHKTPFQGG